MNIAVIVDLPARTSVHELKVALGHTRYYRKFMHNYTMINVPLEKLLKKEAHFEWSEECQRLLDQLKEKLVLAPILIFLDRKQKFHVHVDVAVVALGMVLAQLREGNIDHPIAFSICKLSKK